MYLRSQLRSSPFIRGCQVLIELVNCFASSDSTTISNSRKRGNNAELKAGSMETVGDIVMRSCSHLSRICNRCDRVRIEHSLCSCLLVPYTRWPARIFGHRLASTNLIPRIPPDTHCHVQVSMGLFGKSCLHPWASRASRLWRRGD